MLNNAAVPWSELSRPGVEGPGTMTSNRPDGARREETELLISHFIPSVELTGSRADKLRKLDTLIVYLEGLRRRLAGNVAMSRPSRTVGSRSWSWFTAGALVGALLLYILLTVFL
jgi:hypothetical protein